AVFKARSHTDRDSIANRRTKPYAMSRFDSLLGEPVGKTVDHENVSDAPIGAESRGQHDCSRHLILSRLLGIARRFLVNNCRPEAFAYPGNLFLLRRGWDGRFFRVQVGRST